jgi:3-oxoacyl-[acyl-carrier-protein] synthase III
MMKTKIAGIGKYLPPRVVKNEELAKIMDTTDEWIQERTGIKERRYAEKHVDTTASIGAKAGLQAIERAGISKDDVDFIIFATLSPDYYFPGSGVLVQRLLGITHREVGCLDIRNQCSGFVYAISIADQFIKSGMYKNILVIGAELHSTGLDFTDKGRNVAVIFGDGAGAVLLQATNEENQGILTTHLHADGTFAEELSMISPGTHSGVYHDNLEEFGFPSTDIFGEVFVTQKMVDDRLMYPHMNGQLVFKTAVVKFPEVIKEALTAVNLQASDIDMLVPHQANLRISSFVQKTLGLPDEKVYNNIQRYGNTTAASIPIALCEAWEEGKIKRGDLVCLAAFGAGFTWGSALIRW